MWDDATALRKLANLLFGIAAALVLYGVAHHVVHLPLFAVREIRVIGETAHVTREQVEEVVSREMRGNFFTSDLDHARAAFEKLPWVRRVNVRRQWPDQLVVVVEEHRPLARWGSTALVSAQGEVFEAAINSALPVLTGPEGSAPDVVARFIGFERMLASIDRKILQIRLSPRRAWQVKLDDGMVLELGRDNMEERLASFVAAYGAAVARLPAPPNYVDLRYSNGFAVRSPGLKWGATKA